MENKTITLGAAARFVQSLTPQERQKLRDYLASLGYKPQPSQTQPVTIQ